MEIKLPKKKWNVYMESLEKSMPTRVRIVSILKKALFAGEYKCGDELSLTDIAARLGVSRTPVREAFQTLASEDLIELRMNKGAVVKSIDEKFIVEHYEMRILLESEAAARAARRGMDTGILLAQLYHMEDNMDTLDRNDYEKLNLDIHMAIWTAADNRKLFNYLSNLWNGPSTGYADSEKDHFCKSTQEHIWILRNIKAQEPEQAHAAMTAHITRSMENIVNSFRTRQQIGYRDIPVTSFKEKLTTQRRR